MMASGNLASSAAAADELVKLGRPAVPQVGRFAQLAQDVAARDVLVGALTRIGLDDSIALLQAYASWWPPKADGPVRALVATLRARRDPRLAVVVDLRPGDGLCAARVPPDAAEEI